MMSYVASSLVGAVVGLIASAIFAVILRKISERNSREAVVALRTLIGLVLGAGLADYLVFDFIIKAGGLTYYLVGFSVVFLLLGGWIMVDWLRKS